MPLAGSPAKRRSLAGLVRESLGRSLERCDEAIPIGMVAWPRYMSATGCVPIVHAPSFSGIERVAKLSSFVHSSTRHVRS